MLIGLHGKARVGKDTAYGMIAEDFAGRFVEVMRDAFADRLKISAARSLGWHGADEEGIVMMNLLKLDGAEITVFIPTSKDGQSGMGKTFSGRQYLQWYGTEGHRDVFNTDFWVDAVLPSDWLNSGDKILVITDVRFPNEAQRIKQLGGDVWHIVRPEVETDDTHASEQVLPGELIDYTIVNDGTLAELRTHVHNGVWLAMHQNVPDAAIQIMENHG